ncbi:MAG: hypothetical protein VR70_06910 [Rhodospirillaceae bacterium BRH_c57]|nr:MAG: hypothetical protein VR70_06910 [Rhodospirillaceae bacterium BRH_c57]
MPMWGLPETDATANEIDKSLDLQEGRVVRAFYPDRFISMKLYETVVTTEKAIQGVNQRTFSRITGHALFMVV